MTEDNHTAGDIAAAVYRACDLDLDWTDRPDGTELLTLANGCRLAIGDDDIREDGDNGGINWTAYTGDNDPADSGGWSNDDAHKWGQNGNTWSVEKEIAGIVKTLEWLAQR